MQIYIDTDKITDKALAAQLLQTNFAGTALAGTVETDEDYATGIVVVSSSFIADPDFLPEADDRATDGEAVVKRYTIDGAEVFLLTTPHEKGLFIADEGTTTKQIVAGFHHDVSLAEHLASWGFDGTPDEAQDTATNVRVWVEPCYYSGTIGAPIGHYAREDGQYDARVFATVAEAQAYIDEQESGVYVLGNGEAGRPTYTICE